MRKEASNLKEIADQLNDIKIVLASLTNLLAEQAGKPNPFKLSNEKKEGE
jgi:hypothetical protein